MAATEFVQVRVTGPERQTVDTLLVDLVEKFPVVTKATLLRAALRLGLAQIKDDPQLVLAGSTALPKPRRVGS